MAIALNGKKLVSGAINGKNLKEAWMNGSKMWPTFPFSPTAYYPLNGNTLDESGNNYTVSEVDGTITYDVGLNNKQAFLCDGSNAIQLNDVVCDSEGLCYSMLIKHSTGGGFSYFYMGGSLEVGEGCSIMGTANVLNVFNISLNSEYHNLISDIKKGTWNHVIMYANIKNARAFFLINGKKIVVTCPTIIDYTKHKKLWIGRGSLSGGRVPAGVMFQDFIFWDHTNLPSEEVVTNELWGNYYKNLI